MGRICYIQESPPSTRYKIPVTQTKIGLETLLFEKLRDKYRTRLQIFLNAQPSSKYPFMKNEAFIDLKHLKKICAEMPQNRFFEQEIKKHAGHLPEQEQAAFRMGFLKALELQQKAIENIVR